MISNWKKVLVSIVYTNIFQRCNGERVTVFNQSLCITSGLIENITVIMTLTDLVISHMYPPPPYPPSYPRGDDVLSPVGSSPPPGLHYPCDYPPPCVPPGVGCVTMEPDPYAVTGISVSLTPELVIPLSAVTPLPLRHPPENQCWFNVGPTSKTMAQHKTNIGVLFEFCDLTTQHKRCIEPMLFWCWASIVGDGTTLIQHWLNISC